MVRCSNCGENIDFLTNNETETICEHCNTRIRITARSVGMVDFNADGHFALDPDKVLLRCGQLLYIGEYQEAKELVQKTLVYFPENIKLLEMENECSCFLTRDFLNYLRMLSVKTFFIGGLEKRYVAEINGFCNMLSDRADQKINIAIYREQNVNNYNYMLLCLLELKKCISNANLIKFDFLCRSIAKAFLKMTTVICNTIYITNPNKKGKKKYIKLISVENRQELVEYFEMLAIREGIQNLKIADKKEWEKY